MGRQRPATDTFRAISTGTLERLDRAAEQHQQALKRFKGIGNRSARGTADAEYGMHPIKLQASHLLYLNPEYPVGMACIFDFGRQRPVGIAQGIARRR
eukprot:COSAG02_NODE_2362_length_9062_cov_129.948789_2_plen_98_part_00